MARFFHRGKHDSPTGRVARPGEFSELLNSLDTDLKLEPAVRDDVFRELRGHLEDKAEELQASGMSRDQALKVAARCFGPGRDIAREIYEAHSQGNWKQTVLASAPHAAFALLFALNWWQDIHWVLAALAGVVGLSAYGWWRGKPGWFFPWLGYLLVPVIFAGVLLLYLPRALSWIAIVAYLPSTLYLIIRIARQTLRRDWLNLSVMMLPLPVLAYWAVALRWRQVISNDWGFPISTFAPWIALSFAALAIGVAAFIRLRSRRLKLVALLISESVILAIVSLSGAGLPTWTWLLLLPGSALCLIGPAIIESRRSDRQATAWDDTPATGQP